MSEICVLTSVHIANDARVYFKEVKSLAGKGFDVCYAAQKTEELGDDSIKTISLTVPAGRVKRIFSFFSIWRQALKSKAGIYHIQDPELIVTGILLKVFSRKKVIYDVHEDYPDFIRQKEYIPKYARNIIARCMEALEKIASSMFDFIFVADDGVYKRFNPKKTEILYNFPDLRQFEPVMNEEKEFDIIYPGSLSKKIVTHILDTALEVQKAYNKPFSCLLVSNYKFDGGKDWVREQMKLRGIREESILLYDRVPYTQVAMYTSKSKIGFIPLPTTKKFEKNIPTKLFEFMYSGLPIVATDLKPSRQFVEGEDCAILVNINNPEETAEAIISLLENKEKRKKMGEKGRSLVLEKYNWKSQEDKLCRVYENLLRN